MSAPTLLGNAPLGRPRADRGLRLRLKPARRSSGSVQGAWWPRTNQLCTELPRLLAALAPRLGYIDRIVVDETTWAPASLQMDVGDRSLVLEGSSDASTNVLSVLGKGFGRLDLLVVPPTTDPARAYSAVMTASRPDDVSTPDELLGIGAREAADRRLVLLAHQRWESEGGALQAEHGTTGPHVERRKVGLGTSCPQSPSGTDRDVRAESESSC
ncbi:MULTISPECIES: DUF5994 family protein [unclassified Mycobacterium]|uniref:DUF5994 family protein n=1 Tax=unclassified Mycobacterium TaxID=2642494 RepID=UPI0029C99287|nr:MULTISPECIES: DUF5994 family protein [unclassified Mycobacterium]